MYEVLKDFQSIIAAIFALLAAGLAFYSAQRVAQIQSQTSRDLAERQVAAAVAREQESMARQRAAFYIRTVRALTIFITYTGVLSQFCQIIINKEKGENEIDSLWKGFIVDRPLQERTSIVDWTSADISILPVEDQISLHGLMDTIKECDDLIAFFKSAGPAAQDIAAMVDNAAQEARKLAEAMKVKFDKYIETNTAGGVPGSQQNISLSKVQPKT